MCVSDSRSGGHLIDDVDWSEKRIYVEVEMVGRRNRKWETSKRDTEIPSNLEMMKQTGLGRALILSLDLGT
eukprot:5985412-Prymnesium_polylepis.2